MSKRGSVQDRHLAKGAQCIYLAVFYGMPGVVSWKMMEISATPFTVTGAAPLIFHSVRVADEILQTTNQMISNHMKKQEYVTRANNK